MRSSNTAALVLLCSLAFGAGAAEPGDTSPLAGLAEREPDLTTFLRAVEGAGLAGTLTGSAYTAFAPTNDAFARAGMNVETLLKPENVGRLLKLLRAHVVADDIDVNMALSLGQARTIDGGNVDLYMEGDRLMVNDASVVRSGIRRGSLRIYAIDRVLTPPSPKASLRERTD